MTKTRWKAKNFEGKKKGGIKKTSTKGEFTQSAKGRRMEGDLITGCIQSHEGKVDIKTLTDDNDKFYIFSTLRDWNCVVHGIHKISIHQNNFNVFNLTWS